MFEFIKRLFRKKKVESSTDVLLYKELSFEASEAYKLLRTNLSFSLPEEGKCRIIGITSSIRGEGKSTTSVNLSYALAQTGKRVLLVDADLRLPSIAKKLDIPGTPGVTDMLIMAEGSEGAIRRMPDVDCWHVIPAGSIPPNPTEILGSSKMADFIGELSGQYDYIIVDFPPVNIVSDALVASSMLDGILVVVRSEYSSRRELSKCVKHLELSGVKILGFVISSINSRGGSGSRYRKYGKNYYRRGYGYEYSRGAEEAATEQGASEAE
ncbi:MAG: CpsD/CapB family tyrosine-protein kinase [Clostridia bacterium]|nr:CpsD/CapB family tyrosine-protein kinase [Clostridia bacterium]